MRKPIMKFAAALLGAALLVSGIAPGAAHALSVMTAAFDDIVGSKAWIDDSGMIISFNPSATTGHVSVSTDNGFTWNGYTLVTGGAIYGDAVWDSSTDTLWVFWATKPVVVTSDLIVRISRIRYISGTFDVRTENVDTLYGGSLCTGTNITNYKAFLIKGYPVFIYTLEWTGQHPSQDRWYHRLAVINPSTMAKTSLIALASTSSTGEAFYSILQGDAAIVRQGGEFKILAVWVYRKAGYYTPDQYDLNGSWITLTQSGTVSASYMSIGTFNNSLTLHGVWAANESYWVDYTHNGTAHQWKYEVGGISKPHKAAIYSDGTNHWIYSKTETTVYGQRWTGSAWSAKEAWVPDVDRFVVIEGRPREFLVRDAITGFTHYYAPEIPIPDQLNPPSGAYKSAFPTFTWTTSFSQTAFRLTVLRGKEIVHDSGKIMSSQKSYTLPIALERSTPHRVYVSAWDTSGRESWHSTSVLYQFEPRSSMVLTVAEDTYITSNYPSYNYGSSTGMETRYAPPAYGGGGLQSESWVKFDLSPLANPNRRIWDAELTLTAKSGSLESIIVNEVPSTWTESTLTWNNRPSSTLNTYHTFKRSGNKYTWPIASTAESFSITTRESSSITWYTKEDSKNQPAQLRVFYSHAPNTPQPLMPAQNIEAHGSVNFVWKGSDDDTPASALMYDLEYRRDGGPWRPLAYGHKSEQYTWDLTGLQEGIYEVRVRADDGLAKSEFAYFNPIRVVVHSKPYVTIDTPSAAIYGGRNVDIQFTYSHPYGSPMAEATVEVASNPSFTTNVQRQTVTGTNAVFALPEGVWYARVKARESNGLWSDWSEAVMFVVDLTAPQTAVSRTTAAVTNERSVGLRISASDSLSGVSMMQVTTNTASPGPWIPFVQDYAYMLPATDGVYNIYVRVSDKAGNASAWQSVQVTYDTTPPRVLSFAINQGSSRTEGMAVTLQSVVQDSLSGVTHMRLSNDGINWSSKVAYQPTISWTLDGRAGTLTVHAEFFDEAGNSVRADASILYLPDTAAPGVQVTINDGRPVTYSPTIKVRVEATDNATPISELQMRHTVGTQPWSPWIPYNDAPFTVTLPGPGRHTIHVQVQDTNGNTGTAMASVVYAAEVHDALPPPNDMANTVFSAVLSDGTLRELIPTDAFGGRAWITSSTVLRLKGSAEGKQYSITGDDWVNIPEDIAVAAAPGIFTVWLRYRLQDGFYSDGERYKFVYDPIAPTVAAAWANGATATTTGSAEVAVTASDNLFRPSDLTYQYSTDGGATWTDLAKTAAGAGGTVVLGQTKGQYQIIIRVADPAGNETRCLLTIWNL